MDPRKTYIFSGFGYSPDLLLPIAPHPATCFDYLSHANKESFLAELENHSAHPDVVIGWSLGGQIAAHLIATQRLKAKLLVLITTAFSFDPEMAAGFSSAFTRSPHATWRRFHAQVGQHDALATKALSTLAVPPLERLRDIEQWIPALTHYDASHFTLSEWHHFPKTLLIYGENDAILAPYHLEQWSSSLPDAEILSLSGCGHAPHLHDPHYIKSIIINVLSTTSHK